MPMRKTHPRAIEKTAKRHAFSSSSVGSRLRILWGTGSTWPPSRVSMLASTSRSRICRSPRPRNPRRRKLRVPERETRGAVNKSVPMLAIHSPTSIASSAFTSDVPASKHDHARPSDMSAKYPRAERKRCFRERRRDQHERHDRRRYRDERGVAAMPSAAPPARPFLAIW